MLQVEYVYSFNTIIYTYFYGNLLERLQLIFKIYLEEEKHL